MTRLKASNLFLLDFLLPEVLLFCVCFCFGLQLVTPPKRGRPSAASRLTQPTHKPPPTQRISRTAAPPSPMTKTRHAPAAAAKTAVATVNKSGARRRSEAEVNGSEGSSKVTASSKQQQPQQAQKQNSNSEHEGMHSCNILIEAVLNESFVL